jgi:hypothetical protein
MSVNTHAVGPSRLVADLQFGVWDGYAPPARYSDILSATPMEISNAEQESQTLIAVNASSLGEVIDSGMIPSGKAARVKLTAATMTPLMRALAVGARVTEHTQAAAPLVDTRTLALDGWADLTGNNLAAAGTGTEIIVGTGATLATGTEGGNNGLTWTARAPGTTTVTVELDDPTAASATLSVTVTGAAIKVNLATSALSAVTSTAAEVLAAIANSTAASALVSVAHTGDSTGASAVAVVAASPLTGGTVLAATKYQVNLTRGTIKALHADAVGECAISYHTLATVGERYAAGAATSEYVHIMGMVLDQASNMWSPIDIWRARLAGTGTFDPTTNTYNNVVLEGDMVAPKDAAGNWIEINGKTPDSSWEYQRGRTV